MKPCKHICSNCWYFENGNCLNCDSPSDIRVKSPDDVCDGGGLGASVYGFEPKDDDNAYTFTDEDESLIYELSNSEFPLADFWNDLNSMLRHNPKLAERFDIGGMRRDIVKIAKTFSHYYEKKE